MKWSRQQEQGLSAVSEWFRKGEQQVFRFFGKAGTGKSTIAKHFAEGVVKGRVMFAAYTGKAAYVMRSKGCPGASTIHRLIYVPKNKSRKMLIEAEDRLRKMREELGEKHEEVRKLERQIKETREDLSKPVFTLNLDSQLRQASLLVLDECSMVDTPMAKDLMSFGVKILVLGDPEQLPPVRGTGHFTTGKPDFELTEIHRQAADNPIIRMANDITLGKRLSFGSYGNSSIIHHTNFTRRIATAADQMIVGYNMTRQYYNDKFRKMKGWADTDPRVGDKIICLRNNHDLGLLNGELWEVQEVHDAMGTICNLSIKNEEGVAMNVDAHASIFRRLEISHWEQGDAQHFDYGYAITCHKAQGSQWNNIVVYDESHAFKQNAQRWLYTAVTRAAEKVVIVR